MMGEGRGILNMQNNVALVLIKTNSTTSLMLNKHILQQSKLDQNLFCVYITMPALLCYPFFADLQICDCLMQKAYLLTSGFIYLQTPNDRVHDKRLLWQHCLETSQDTGALYDTKTSNLTKCNLLFGSYVEKVAPELITFRIQTTFDICVENNFTGKLWRYNFPIISS